MKGKGRLIFNFVILHSLVFDRLNGNFELLNMGHLEDILTFEKRTQTMWITGCLRGSSLTRKVRNQIQNLNQIHQNPIIKMHML